MADMLTEVSQAFNTLSAELSAGHPVPGLFLSKPADRGLTCSAKRVGHVCISNIANDLKDYASHFSSYGLPVSVLAPLD